MKKNIYIQKERSQKDDEFWTRYWDVQHTLKWYSSEFKKIKNLYIPCDVLSQTSQNTYFKIIKKQTKDVKNHSQPFYVNSKKKIKK